MRPGATIGHGRSKISARRSPIPAHASAAPSLLAHRLHRPFHLTLPKKTGAAHERCRPRRARTRGGDKVDSAVHLDA